MGSFHHRFPTESGEFAGPNTNSADFAVFLVRFVEGTSLGLPQKTSLFTGGASHPLSLKIFVSLRGAPPTPSKTQYFIAARGFHTAPTKMPSLPSFSHPLLPLYVHRCFPFSAPIGLGSFELLSLNRSHPFRHIAAQAPRAPMSGYTLYVSRRAAVTGSGAKKHIVNASLVTPRTKFRYFFPGINEKTGISATLAARASMTLRALVTTPPCHGLAATVLELEGNIHWWAKIKDEVEKLPYQLNEEAERTERPIRRLNKVMYGSTCADMQVDVMGECLSSIKHVVGLEEGRSVTRVAAEFGIAHSIVSRLWRQFQTTGKAIRGFSSGRPRGTTTADDRYIVLQARRNRRQTGGEIARHTTQATGRPIPRFTVTRRLHGGGLFARCPVRCVPLTPAHRRRRSLWCREHRNWRDNEWGRVLFTDESRFSLSSDSHRILIWRERGSRNHPSNII
ncbi:transposable element Tc1 transposase [Trichonephila clavipes]|nr:transposable element Tc1 transposase [Trichonephila clavipes]